MGEHPQNLTLVYVTSQFRGIHKWADAPQATSYLRNPHRHIFKVKVTAIIEKDRGIEYHHLLAALDEVIAQKKDWSRDSCETMAEKIADQLKGFYRIKSVEVSEDGECGSIYVLEP